MTLRERKKEQTREAILAAAFKLFERQGFEGTTVDQIAAEAEVGRRTFFRYFPAKEAVVFPERDARFVRFRDLLADEAGGATPFERVKRALFRLAEDYMDARARLRVQQRIVEASPVLQVHDREIDRAWEEAITAALLPAEGGSEAERRRAALVAGALMGVIRASLTHWQTGGCEGDLLAMGQEAVALLERGVGGDNTGLHIHADHTATIRATE